MFRMYLRAEPCKADRATKQEEHDDAFTASVMLMLIMMVISSGPLSCKANFVLLPANGKGRMGLSSLNMQMLEVLQSWCLFIQTESICRHSRNLREKSGSAFSSSHRHCFPMDPWWRVCDNNYCRQLAGSSYLQTHWVCLLWGVCGCLVYFDTSDRAAWLQGEVPSFATNKRFNFWRVVDWLSSTDSLMGVD